MRSFKDWLRWGYSRATGSTVDYHDMENRLRLAQDACARLQKENTSLRARLAARNVIDRQADILLALGKQ